MSKWKAGELSDIAELVSESYTDRLNWTSFHYLDTGSITQNSISEFQKFHLYDEMPSRAKKIVKDSDIVYSLVRPNQKHYGHLKNIPKGTLVSTGFAVIRSKEKISDSRFIYYFLGQEDIIDHLQKIGEHSTSTYPAIRPEDLSSLSISYPPLPTQKAFAHILGTLDDKIELLRQMNETLEAMARALFQSWFVDFDPVRKKAEKISSSSTSNKKIKNIQESLDTNRYSVETVETQCIASQRSQRVLPKEIEDLFPSEFEDSELGEIPKGWKVGKLGDDFKIKMGQSPSGDTYNEIGLGMPFYQGRTDFGFRFPKIRMYCTDPKRIALKGDTLISVRAPVGDQNIAIEDCCIGRGVGSLRHTSDSISYTYYRIYFLQESLQAYNGEGTVFGSINQDSLNGIKQIIPNLKLIEKFESLSSPLDLKILAQEKEITQLTTLRDSLLPKLISGELDLTDKMISAILEPA